MGRIAPPKNGSPFEAAAAAAAAAAVLPPAPHLMPCLIQCKSGQDSLHADIVVMGILHSAANSKHNETQYDSCCYAPPLAASASAGTWGPGAGNV